MTTEWDSEQEKLNKEKEELKQQCQELQNAIKALKEGKPLVDDSQKK
jgi:hypothetical protein